MKISSHCLFFLQLLERLCETLSAGEPRFNLFTMPKKGKTGKDINYYIYEVSIPRWGNGRWLHPPHLMDSEMAAKELAAQFAVFRITCPMMEDQEIAMEMLKCGVLAQVEVPDTHAVSPNLHQSKTRYEELGNQQLRCNSSSGISSFKSAG